MYGYLNSILGGKVGTVQALDTNCYNSSDVTGLADWYQAEFLLLKPETLKGAYRNKKYLMVRCGGGFGCNPSNTGKAVGVWFCDGDHSMYGRDQILGEAKESVVREWEAEYGAFPAAPF